MKNNQILLDSPFLPGTSYISIQHNKNNISPNKDQYPFQKLILSSPDYLSNHKFHHQIPQSPWSFLLNSTHQQKKYHLSIPQIFSNQIHKQQIIQEKLIYSDEQQNELMTPIKNQFINKNQLQNGQIHTTCRKSSYDNINKKLKNKEKGLRKLSQKAYQIVQQLQYATYKQVAARLVLQLNEQDFQGQMKDEQNIKRRVYDALNVLISLGVFKKEGRRVVNKKIRDRQNTNRQQSQQLMKLRAKIYQKQIQLLKKTKKIQQIKLKLKIISSIFLRNKYHTSKIQSYISFPFIGIQYTQTYIQSQKILNHQLEIISTEQIKPFGDIDSLQWIYPISSPSIFYDLQHF